MRRIALVTALLVATCGALDAYVFLGSRWADGNVVMQLQLGSSGTLLDGSSSWGVSAEDALATWNNYISRAQFRVVRDSTAPTGSGNGYNNVFFSSSQYGSAFGSSTLAVTLSRYYVSTGLNVETDVLFNTAFSWNSYSGNLRSASSGGTLIDFHRVALHEFGHVLGLDHPDQYGQSVSAIMNSRITNTDRLQSDDIAGVQALYGGASPPPTSPPGAPSNLTTSSSGSTVFLSWSAPSTGGSPTAYVIEAGSASGLTNLANFSTGNTFTSYSSGGVGAGTYFVRVRATNAAGTGGASNESRLVVGGGGCTSAPAAPAGLALTYNVGGTVSFSWNGASGATTYVIEAGSSPGLSNLANSDLGSSATSATFSGVGAGTYYVRLRARNGCGTSGTSNEVLLVVGTGAPTPAPTGTISETFTGTLTGGEALTCSDTVVVRPCRIITFRVNGSGTLSATMTWAESPDIDLSLWRGGSAVSVSRGVTNTETFSTAVSPGDYEYHVTYYEGPGSANYTIRVTRPQ